MNAVGLIERGFLPLALGLSALALAHPPLFTWIAPHIALGLGVIMFGMGLTLDFSDFGRAFRNWRGAGTGIVLQYTIMPILAVAVSALLGLPPEAAVGLVLVGACPGGTASNVITYLARADVALSVVMTLVSTMLAPLVTPALVQLLLGHEIQVDFWAMVRSVFWIVLFPLLDGLIIRSLLRDRLRPVACIFPAISMVTISLIIACVVGLNQKTILAFPALVMAAVVLHNAAGFGLGYHCARLMGSDATRARTISIEVGMQNSGLAVALAGAFFGPAAALPGAIFSLWQNLVGVALARRWSRTNPPKC
ncbi:Bile acid:sodium symporter [Alkalidesulfovibrio alkalitolerans DSM 16529]|jgi:BASS family bile acid:Na+ symporter|uniref:Bile acid:sodium symporter n=1 Tax=Alkalidesulfovibrio alkalitolerans DSM 16529 TaxID=1121439 RepID=S7TEB4_9BACT|nr:bile acid:sodium symporter family protein [Alkalidesulfovibrio alkalitolerans]EPR35031.1 Bile acid:sodium symporter [Alkalidesulfovibrio alkalitolerans DSM 16529]